MRFLPQSRVRDDEIPAIYVADLVAYGRGKLQGKWIEILPESTLDSLQSEIDTMLKEKGIELSLILKWKHLPGLDRLTVFPKLAEAFEVAKATHSHGHGLVSAYLSYFPIHTLSELKARFIGTYSNLAEYARDLMGPDSLLDSYIEGLPLTNYFDYQGFGVDLIRDGYLVSLDLPRRFGDKSVALFSTDDLPT